MNAIGPDPVEISRDDGKALLLGLVDDVLDLVYDSPDVTHSGRSRAQVESLLLETMPSTGVDHRNLSLFVRSVFAPHVRSYRHPLHFGHQRPAPSLASTAADMLNAATNTTVSVYEAGPISVALEATVQRWMRELFGLPATASATFTNGGSESTLTALLCARERWQRANPDNDFRTGFILIGAECHYCVERSARVLGFPVERVCKIATNDRGQTCLGALEIAVERIARSGSSVVAVVVNAGSTAVAAFDDIAAIGAVAHATGAWLHVDATHGGAAVFVPELRDRLDGIECADSFAWDPHKLMWVSPPCACLFVRCRKDLHLALSQDLDHASYIVDRTDRDGLDLDVNESLEWTLACTRQCSALKVYLSVLLYGADATALRVRRVCALALELARNVARDDRFDLLCHPEFNIVCFRFLTKDDRPDTFNRRLRDRIAVHSTCYLTGASVHGVYWLRAQFTSEATTSTHLHLLLDEIAREASALSTHPFPHPATEPQHADD